MTTRNIPILVLESDPLFRDRLKTICSEIGRASVVGNVDQALGLLIRQSFQLLLLDWSLIQTDPSSFALAINSFQPRANRAALFNFPQLKPVVGAMKSGMGDALWAGEATEALRDKIKDCLAQVKPAPLVYSSVSQLAESLSDKAIKQKISFFKARKEFSKTFLFQILNLKKMRRSQLASLMDVSSRTLHRHLSA